MTFWEFLGAILSSAGLFASILGAFLIYAARKNGEATRDLIRSMEERTTKHFSESFERMDRRAGDMTKHFSELFERMDRRAEERHREVIETISALRTT